MRSTRPRLGVMGGTFDPIHHGHLVAASEVASVFDLDEVVFVPTGQPWQKTDRDVAPAEDRYLMTVIATASNPRSRNVSTDTCAKGVESSLPFFTMRTSPRRLSATNSLPSGAKVMLVATEVDTRVTNVC